MSLMVNGRSAVGDGPIISKTRTLSNTNVDITYVEKTCGKFHEIDIEVTPKVTQSGSDHIDTFSTTDGFDLDTWPELNNNALCIPLSMTTSSSNRKLDNFVRIAYAQPDGWFLQLWGPYTQGRNGDGSNMFLQ